MVDPEPRRVEQHRDERVVGGREAIDASVLEPVRLVNGNARALGRLLDRHLPVQARTGERRVGRRG